VNRHSIALLVGPLCLALSSSAFAYDGSITQLEVPLATNFQTTYCHPPQYAPALYPINSSELGMLTQGNCLNNCDVGDGDSIFYWKEAANGTWTKPTTASGAMPAFKATLSESPQIADPCPTTNQLTSYQGAFGGPEIVKDTAHTGSKLYMAYLQPVGDWWAGEIGWAVSSDDGLTWTKQTQPLIYALAHRGHQSSGSCPEGFSALGLTTTTDGTGTWFHV